MKTPIAVLGFLMRHFLWVCAATVVGCVMWTVLYFVLLLVAVIFNSGVGGPLALPAGLLAVVCTSIGIGWGLFAPACAVGNIVCRIFRLPGLAAIPFVFLAGGIISVVLYWGCAGCFSTHMMIPLWKVALYYAIYLSIPLGIYWWIAEGPGALFDAFKRWIRRRRSTADNLEP